VTVAPRFLPSSGAGPAAALAPVGAINPVVRAGWYGFVASIPFELPHVDLPIEVPTLTGAVFLLTTLLHLGACYRRVPGALLWFTLYLWVMGISALVNGLEHGDQALSLGLWFAQLLLIFWAASNLLRREEVFRGTLIALALACAARSGIQVMGIATEVVPVWGGGERIVTLGQNPNLAAMILSAGLIAALSLRTANGRGGVGRLLVTWTPAALIGAAIIQTGSRGGVICAVMGLLVLLFAGRARLGTIFLGFVAVGTLALGIARSDTLRRRFLSAEAGNLAGRERIYPAGLEMVRERPLIGWGPIDNMYELARRIDERKRPWRDMHNLVLELLTAAGAIGAIPFLIGLGLCVGAAWSARGTPRGAVPLALLGAIAFGTISGTWIVSKILWLALAIGTASGQAGRRYVTLAPVRAD
jgi:O-antigen ligase